MKNLLLLCLCLLCTSCATKPANTTAPATLPGKESQPPIFDNLTIGMLRTEAERILGEPTSVTDTATGTTSVWVFGQGASKAAPPPEPKNDGELINQIGSIAATTAGIFIPYAGVVSSIGSQVYSMSNTGYENTSSPNQPIKDNTRIVTIEFRDNKVFSIQRARPISAPLPASNK